MPKPTVATLSLDPIVQEPASQTVSQTAGAAYLVSFGVVALLIIGIFFGIAFSLIAPRSQEQITIGSAARDRGSEVKALGSTTLQDPDSNAQSVPRRLELRPSASSGAASLPVAQAPAAAQMSSDDAISVTAATDASSGVATRKATLVTSAIGPPQGVASNPPAAPRPAAPPPNPPAVAEVAEFLARGDTLLLAGDIASARLFYRRAADAGDARGALRMGATFDPAFLSRAGLDSASGDPPQARFWYRRALDLRPTEAGRRHRRWPRTNRIFALGHEQTPQ